MSQVDDEFNELEEEMWDDHDAAQENDPGLSAENKEQQSEPCVSHPSTVKSADEAPAREQPSEAAHKSAPEESINVAKATEPKDNVAQGVCVSVEAEQSLQPRERKLKPAFKKPTKTAIQQEERATEKPIAEESAPGNRTDSASAEPIKRADAIAADPASESIIAVPQAMKRKLPVKKAAAKAKPASGPPDPCSFNSTGKSRSNKKTGGKHDVDACATEKAPKADAPGKSTQNKARHNKRPHAKSAYMFFCSEQRDVIKADEKLSFADVGRRLGEIWRGLDENDKRPYQEQAEEDKARVAAMPDSKPPEPKSKNPTPLEKNKFEIAKSVGDQLLEKTQKAPGPKEKANSRRGGSRARKGKANEVLAAETSAAEDEEQYGSDFDWEAEHEAVDWSNNPAECILAVTMKGKYVVKRKGLPLHEYGLVDVQASKRHCSGEANASGSVCPVTKQMINDFESSKKGFEKDTIDHMSSRELDLDDLDQTTKLEACAFLGDMRREGLLDRKGCKIWSFPDERMSVPIMGTSYLVQRLLECERLAHMALIDENKEMKDLLSEHGIKWPSSKYGDQLLMEE